MRGLPSIFLLALAVALGGCASSTTSGVCARASAGDLSRELAWPSFQDASFRHKNARAPIYRTSPDLAAMRAAKAETPEPRFTSTEWWKRENARLARATIICRGCLPGLVATVAPPEPAILMPDPDLGIPSASIGVVEGSAGLGAPQQP
jgi:hypothetical protein